MCVFKTETTRPTNAQTISATVPALPAPLVKPEQPLAAPPAHTLTPLNYSGPFTTLAEANADATGYRPSSSTLSHRIFKSGPGLGQTRPIPAASATVAAAAAAAHSINTPSEEEVEAMAAGADADDLQTLFYVGQRFFSEHPGDGPSIDVFDAGGAWTPSPTTKCRDQKYFPLIEWPIHPCQLLAWGPAQKKTNTNNEVMWGFSEKYKWTGILRGRGAAGRRVDPHI